MAELILCDGGIYAIRNIVNGKVYIGSSVKLTSRIKEHKRKLSQSRHENDRLQKAFGKYGDSAFVFEVIERVALRSQVLVREQHWIDFYNSADRNIGYNIYPVAGSPSGTKPSDESRLRMSISGKKRPQASEETRKRISLALKGKKRTAEQIENHRKSLTGYKHSDELKAKLSAMRKGVKKSATEIMNRSNAIRGQKRSDETRAKMSKPRSPEAVANMRQARSERRWRNSEKIQIALF